MALSFGSCCRACDWTPMSSSSAVNPDDHWRRLAAELGLDPGPEPEPPAAQPEDVIGDDEAPPEAVEPEVPVAEAERPAPSGRGRRRRAAPREEAEPVAEAPA